MAFVDVETRNCGYSLGVGTISFDLNAAKSIWLGNSYEKAIVIPKISKMFLENARGRRLRRGLSNIPNIWHNWKLNPDTPWPRAGGFKGYRRCRRPYGS